MELSPTVCVLDADTKQFWFQYRPWMDTTLWIWASSQFIIHLKSIHQILTSPLKWQDCCWGVFQRLYKAPGDISTSSSVHWCSHSIMGGRGRPVDWPGATCHWWRSWEMTLSLCCSDTDLVCHVQCWQLDKTISKGPFQLQLFWDSTVLW